MSFAVRSLVPVLYVADVRSSTAFYELLGFTPLAVGADGQWSWAYMRSGSLGILLAGGAAPDADERGPVQLYLQCEDLAELQERLAGTTFPAEHLGYPNHAPGGELRLVDPDNHVLMIGQTAGAPKLADLANERPDNRASILRRAAEAVRRRGVSPQSCQVGEPGGLACSAPAEVKLTDSWGDTAWSCLRHADQVVVGAPGVYLATEDAQGLAPYLAGRRRPVTRR